MSRVSALRVVREQPFYKKEVELCCPESGGQAHSLQYAVPLPRAVRPENFAYFINKFSAVGESVLDPFCGSGECALEAALLGRLAYGSDTNPLYVKIAKAKLEPADITEVTLKLQTVNLRAPINSKLFSDFFSAFYDIDTFRELINLRRWIESSSDSAGAFVELMALGLLHGHSAGYFSVYSFPQVSLSPREQSQLNAKRHQIPDYRALVPRILRKTASVMRDGLPSVLRRSAAHSRLVVRDARDLSYLKSASVDLVVTSVPLPESSDHLSGLWLKFWFAGIDPESFGGALAARHSVSSWLDFMNEALLELARVVKPGKRAVFDLRDVRLAGKQELLDELLIGMLERDLARYWDIEGILINKLKSAALKDSLQARDNTRGSQKNRIMVLRRR